MSIVYKLNKLENVWKGTTNTSEDNSDDASNDSD